MALIKFDNITQDTKKYVVYSLQKYIDYHDYKGFILLDFFNKVHIDKNELYIPQNFLNKVMFISAMSFQQNNIKLANPIRKYVNKSLQGAHNIVCIGGESYMYALINNFNYIYHLTNNKYIYDDCNYNNGYMRKRIYNYLTNYDDLDTLPNIKQGIDICLVNLSKLNYNLVKLLNDSNYNKIIIINCNHDDFWKKKTYLTNYKLKSREYFVCEYLNQFITVTILALS